MSNFLSQAQEIGMQGQTSHGHVISLFPTFFAISLYGAAISTIIATGQKVFLEGSYYNTKQL